MDKLKKSIDNKIVSTLRSDPETQLLIYKKEILEDAVQFSEYRLGISIKPVSFELLNSDKENGSHLAALYRSLVFRSFVPNSSLFNQILTGARKRSFLCSIPKCGKTTICCLYTFLVSILNDGSTNAIIAKDEVNRGQIIENLEKMSKQLKLSGINDHGNSFPNGSKIRVFLPHEQKSETNQRIDSLAVIGIDNMSNEVFERYSGIVDSATNFLATYGIPNNDECYCMAQNFVKTALFEDAAISICIPRGWEVSWIENKTIVPTTRRI